MLLFSQCLRPADQSAPCGQLLWDSHCSDYLCQAHVYASCNMDLLIQTVVLWKTTVISHIWEEDQDRMRACMHAKLGQTGPAPVTHGLWPTRLLCPWDFQERILEGVAISVSLVFVIFFRVTLLLSSRTAFKGFETSRTLLSLVLSSSDFHSEKLWSQKPSQNRAPVLEAVKIQCKGVDC